MIDQITASHALVAILFRVDVDQDSYCIDDIVLDAFTQQPEGLDYSDYISDVQKAFSKRIVDPTNYDYVKGDGEIEDRIVFHGDIDGLGSWLEVVFDLHGV